MRFRPISYAFVIAALALSPLAHAAVDVNHKSSIPRPEANNDTLVGRPGAVSDKAPESAPADPPASVDAAVTTTAPQSAAHTPPPALAPSAEPMAAAQTAPKLGDPTAAWFGTIGVIGALQAFLLLVGLAVLWKVRVAAEAGARDARRGADASERAALAAERMASESRVVGEAQARAYVAVKPEKISFDWPEEATASPVIEISAANSGRSPAREFVWNATVQYIRDRRRLTRSIVEGWPPDSGVIIPASGSVRDSASIEASVAGFAASFDEPVTDFVARLKLAFRYRDVFGRVTEDAAYFIAVVEQTRRRAGSAQTIWSGDFYGIAAPSDWDAQPEPPREIEVEAASAAEPELPLQSDVSRDVQIAMADIASAVGLAVEEAAPAITQDAPATADDETAPVATTSDEPEAEARRAAE